MGRLLYKSKKLVFKICRWANCDLWGVVCTPLCIYDHIWSGLSDQILSKLAELPTMHPIQFKLSLLNVLQQQNGPKSRFLTIFSLMTLTFDLKI